jgi:hypothetical protein
MVRLSFNDSNEGEHMAKEATKKIEEVSETEINEPIETPASTRPTDEQIAERAYHIYLERDGADGNPDEDWLQAERDLTEAPKVV